MKKIAAFTLVEALLALSVVGIISAMTLPALRDTWVKKTYKAQLEANVHSMTNAVKMLLMVERTAVVRKTSLYKTGSDNVTDTAGAFIKKYFVVVQDCGTAPGECFASSYKDASGNAISLPSSGASYCAKMITGASICVVPNTGNYPGAVIVDVNGKAKPNKSGSDLYSYYIYNDGTVGIYGTNILEEIAKQGMTYGTSSDKTKVTDPSL